MSFFITWATDSAVPIQVYPGRDYLERRERRGASYRTITGVRHDVVLSDQWAFTVPLSWVSSALTSEINQRWRDQAEVIWSETLSTSPLSVRCRIENENVPLSQREFSGESRYHGVLLLRESNRGGRGAVGPFILDDPTWGLLDQTYNGLL